jgi:hypothetical protein
MIIDVATHHQESFFLPTPILEHLAWALDEVALDPGPTKPGAPHIRAELVHNVPELYTGI